MILPSQTVRSIFLLIALFVPTLIWGEEIISNDIKAKELIAQAREDLREGDADPHRIIAATLGFTRLLDYYKNKGDTEKVCEMQANVYWCKKQMNLDTLRLYLDKKGESAKETYRRSEKIAMAEIPKNQADDYFSRAEAYAKTNPNDDIMIAIRYFEVADRFTGLPVSLKAQRLSLDYLRKAASSGKNTKDSIGNELKAKTAIAGELPEIATKAINESNAKVGEITAKASQELELARRRAIDTLLKEADIEQKKGSLDTLIALQSQIANMDEVKVGITITGKSAVDSYLAAKAAALKKTNSEITPLRQKLSNTLENLQKEEVRKGNISGATAIKEARESILLAGNDDGTTRLSGNGSRLGIAVVKFSGVDTSDRLGDGVVLFSNRGYVAKGVKETLKGITFTKNPGGSSKPVTVKILKPGIVYLGVSGNLEKPNLIQVEKIEKNGWKRDSALDFKYNDSKQTDIMVYSRIISSNTTIPYFGGWSGSIVMAKEE